MPRSTRFDIDGVKCTAQLTSAGCSDYSCETTIAEPGYCPESIVPEEDATCQDGYIKTIEGDCVMVKCYVPCVPSCERGLKAYVSDAIKCDYTCVKKGGKTTDGGGDTTDGTDGGGGGKTKVCKGRNCKRKNLRA